MISRSQLALPVAYRDRSGYIIRLVPALNLAALNARPRQDKQLLLWYCLRSIDSTGRGVLEQEETIAILRASFGYQRQTVYKHLEAGDGIYWRKYITRKGQAIIILRSLERVAQHLQADIRKRERFMELPASGLPPSGQMQGRRAFLYGSGAYKHLSAPVNHPISRKSLEEKTGIEPRQQRRYDQVMETQGVVREATFSYYRDRNTSKLRSLERVVETDRGLFWTNQIPNRYWIWCPGGSRGMLPKIARSLRLSNQSSIRGEATFDTNNRRYFRDSQSFIRAAARGKATEGFYPSRTSSRKYILEAAW